MRISGLLIFILLVAVGGFVYLGYSEPEFSYRTQIDVKAPVNVTFSGFIDDARMGRWMSGFVSIALLRGEPNQAGGVYRLRLLEDGRNVVATRQIIALKENERVAFELEQSTMTTSVEVLFEPTDTGTFVASYNTVRGNGLFWRAMLRLRRGDMVQRQQQDYQRLKTMIESS